MPRASTSPANLILGYFRTAPLENADLLLDLSKGAVKERHEKADAAREAQAKAAKAKAKAAGAGTIPAGVVGQAKTKAKSHHKKKPGPKPGTHRGTGNGSTQEPATVNDSNLPDPGDQTGLDLE